MSRFELSRRSILAGLLLAPLAPAGAAALEGTISLVGYNDMAEMLGALNVAFRTLHPAVRITSELNGTRFGPAALAEGRALIAPMGALFTPAQMTAYRSRTGLDPVAIPIAHASLSAKALSGPNAVFVHRDNPLESIDMATLARLFTGSPPVLWRELGVQGPLADRPVLLARMAPETPLALEMQAAAFPGVAFAAAMKGFSQSRDIIAYVGGEPTALGFAALNRGTDSVRALGIRRRPGEPAVFASADTLRAETYPLDRHLWLYLRQDRSGKLNPLARAYAALALSDRGQEIVGSGSLGYLALSDAERRRARARCA